jgi:Holliday junction resolvase-like predicted endonuclease
MGIRENKVEKYLDDEVNFLGGITRKWVSPGRDGVPDRIVILFGTVWFVEVKTTDGKTDECKLSEVQKREHTRLRAAGANVVTVYGKEGVDEFIRILK